MADQPQERSGEALQDESFEQVKALWTVDFHSHNQQAPYPSGPDLHNALHPLPPPPVRGPHLKNPGIKPLFLQHRQPSLAPPRKCLVAAKDLQHPTPVSEPPPRREEQE